MTRRTVHGDTSQFRRHVSIICGLIGLAGALALAPMTETYSSSSVDVVTKFLLAVAVILVITHVCGGLMRRIGQPPVLGEVIGGLLLGPTAFGALWPDASSWLLTQDVLEGLDKIAQLGLVVFMFLLGCELRLDRIGKRVAIAGVVAGGVMIPFAAGTAIAVLAHTTLAGPQVPQSTYVLFVGVALSITAVPVLARILIDLGLENTRVGALALSSAAIGDGLAWLALTIILTTVGTVSSNSVGEIVFSTVALVLFTWLCVRPILKILAEKLADNTLTVTLVTGALVYGATTQIIGLHPVIGAFLFGVAVPRGSSAVKRCTHQLQGFTLLILLPLFFAGVGLNTSLGLLGASVGNWLLLVGILLAAVLTKIIGAGGGAWLAGIPWKESVHVGILMNCRGVTELVVATIGLKYGVINDLCFTILVLVAVITTAVTGAVMNAIPHGRRSTTPYVSDVNQGAEREQSSPAGGRCRAPE